jgi:hypothetical protein
LEEAIRGLNPEERKQYEEARRKLDLAEPKVPKAKPLDPWAEMARRYPPRAKAPTSYPCHWTEKDGTLTFTNVPMGGGCPPR